MTVRAWPPRPRLLRAGALWVCLLLLQGLAGCTAASPPPRHRAEPVDDADLVASVSQFRSDEGTANLTAGITNHGRQTIRVTKATITWPGLRFPEVRLGGTPVPPTQTAAFKISYGAAHCSQAITDGPLLVATVNGRATRLRLGLDDPSLLRRLHASKCAQQRLARVASVRLITAAAPEELHGAIVLPGWIVWTREPGSTAPLRLVDLGGSVLIALVPRHGPAAMPAILGSGQQVLRFPVLFGSTHRCDGHALGQSQQTFLLSDYVRLPGSPTQRQILALTKQNRAALQTLIDRACHLSG